MSAYPQQGVREKEGEFVIAHGESPVRGGGQGPRMDAEKASETREPREASDGKDARLGYEADTPADHVMTPGGEDEGDIDLKTSKWQGDGQKARTET